jgi:hypothetical protein
MSQLLWRRTHTYVRYIRFVRFSFPIMNGRFVTLKGMKIKSVTPSAPPDDHGQFCWLRSRVAANCRGRPHLAAGRSP